jgi:voltage-dependent potassium channel beta subunit
MEYRFLGRSGLRVSALSFGAWVTFGDQIGDVTAYECMHIAKDAGVNFFDNAEVYANGEAETMMGAIIKRAGWKREDIILSTKIFWGGDGVNDTGLSRKHIVEGTHAALRRLQTDYVDLLFCHRPDMYTPVEETVWAMNLLIQQGKALYWGSSEWSAERIREAYHIARREHLIPPIVEQPQYNMFTRDRVEREYADLYRDIGLGTTIWSPLASGVLTGKYSDGIPEGSRMALPSYDWLRKRLLSDQGQANIAKTQKLTPIAEELGATISQLAIAWCLKNSDVSTVITGASNAAQVVENMDSLRFLPLLSNDIMQRIEEVLQNRPPAEIQWRTL